MQDDIINTEYFEKTGVPIPPWAKGATNDYTVFGALLPTRDGRHTGNSVVTRVTVTESGVRIMVATEAGNVVGPLSLKAIEGMYHRPEFYCEFKEFPGNAGKAWNEFILQEQEEEDYRNFVPEIEMPFLDSTSHMDAEVRVMGQDGKPHWMPLTEIVEYMQTNTPKPLIDEINEKIHKVVEDNGPVDKGQHIGVPPVPAEIYWCPINQNFYDYSGSGMGDEFYRTWLSRTNEFPLWDANDDGA